MNMIMDLNMCHVSSFNSKTIGISQNPLLDVFLVVICYTNSLFNPNYLASDQPRFKPIAKVVGICLKLNFLSNHLQDLVSVPL